MTKRTGTGLIAIILVAVVATFTTGLLADEGATVKVDPKLPDYQKVQGVAGSIKSVGSDTMNNMMTLWSEGFLKLYPNVQVEIDGRGSSTAPPALIEGTSTFGPMSRPWKSKEIDEFEEKYGYKPVQLPTAIDMLAIFVHKDNPIAEKGLTLPQVDAIFSSTRKLGYPTDVTGWGQLGLTGDWGDLPISLYGRNSASGTYGYLKDHALGKGDYKESVKEQPGSAAVVQAVGGDKSAIGYSGIGYKTADVKAVPLAADEKSKMIPATPDNAYTGQYPLARFLLLSVNCKPGEKLDPLRREFIKYVFSKQGQEVVIKDGYFPISAVIATKALSMVGIEQESEDN